MFTRIVVGCDGTAQGRDAVALAATIASATGAGVSLVGVYPTALFPVPRSTDRGTLRRQAEEHLRRDCRELAPGALTHTVADTSVPRALRHYAEQWHADLLVIGSQPSSEDGHTQIGRRGRQLLYDAPCALAIAQHGLHARALTLGRIGVGYDDGPEARAALDYASALGQAAGSRLLVRTVVEDFIPPLAFDQRLPLTEWSALWETQRQVALEQAADQLATLRVDAEASATVGDPGEDLRQLSRELDLLVVGSRRWGPVARLVSGGVGEALVGDARCSVLIVPRPPGTKAGNTPQTLVAHSSGR